MKLYFILAFLHSGCFLLSPLDPDNCVEYKITEEGTWDTVTEQWGATVWHDFACGLGENRLREKAYDRLHKFELENPDKTYSIDYRYYHYGEDDADY